jgi:hypothetical protein
MSRRAQAVAHTSTGSALHQVFPAHRAAGFGRFGANRSQRHVSRYRPFPEAPPHPPRVSPLPASFSARWACPPFSAAPVQTAPSMADQEVRPRVRSRRAAPQSARARPPAHAPQRHRDASWGIVCGGRAAPPFAAARGAVSPRAPRALAVHSAGPCGDRSQLPRPTHCRPCRRGLLSWRRRCGVGGAGRGGALRDVSVRAACRVAP